MLSGFDIRNFKSYREATLHLSPLTVLIGANASGKSNLIEALWLLSRMAKGNTLAGIRFELRDEQGPVRGKMDSLGYHGSDRFALACTTRRLDWNRYDIEIEIPQSGAPRVFGESMTGPVMEKQFPSVTGPLFEVVRQRLRTVRNLASCVQQFRSGVEKKSSDFMYQRNACAGATCKSGPFQGRT